MQFDILILNSTILSQDPDMPGLIEPGYVAISNGEIADIGPMDGLAATSKADKTIDATGHLVMPGLVNTHTHAPMTLFRGLADDLPLMTWLNEHIFPLKPKTSTRRWFIGAQNLQQRR